MLDPRAASQLMARLRDQSVRHDPLAGLSGQERKILELIGEGLTNRQIGERMFLAEKTVKNYVSALFAKLGMERRTQAAAYAVRVFGDDHGTGGEPHLGLRNDRRAASASTAPVGPGMRAARLGAHSVIEAVGTQESMMQAVLSIRPAGTSATSASLTASSCPARSCFTPRCTCSAARRPYAGSCPSCLA